MTEKPIIFSAAMVQALLAGRKDQTRRVIKKPAALDCLAAGFEPSFLALPGNRDLLPINVVPGDRLWVRETHAVVGTCDPGWVLYRASGYASECFRHGFDRPYPPEPRWKPSIHMPRWASRITLLVTDVRVQRLQEISEEDAVAEGCPCQTAEELAGMEARGWFHDLWHGLHGPDAWDRNDWVAAYTFTVEDAKP